MESCLFLLKIILNSHVMSRWRFYQQTHWWISQCSKFKAITMFEIGKKSRRKTSSQRVPFNDVCFLLNSALFRFQQCFMCCIFVVLHNVPCRILDFTYIVATKISMNARWFTSGNCVWPRETRKMTARPGSTHVNCQNMAQRSKLAFMDAWHCGFMFLLDELFLQCWRKKVLNKTRQMWTNW